VGHAAGDTRGLDLERPAVSPCATLYSLGRPVRYCTGVANFIRSSASSTRDSAIRISPGLLPAPSRRTRTLSYHDTYLYLLPMQYARRVLYVHVSEPWRLPMRMRIGTSTCMATDLSCNVANERESRHWGTAQREESSPTL
jgi:hypothetical protein